MAVGLSRLGTPSRIVACLGEDLHADYLRRVLLKEGVDTNFLYTSNEFSTAQCYVFATVDEDNSFYNFPKTSAAADLDLEKVGEEQIENAACLHATGISMMAEPRTSAVLAYMQLARKKGLIVSFDAGFPTGFGATVKKAVTKAVSQADIIKMNLPEFVYWSKQLYSLDLVDPAALSLYDNQPCSGFESQSLAAFFEMPREAFEKAALSFYKESNCPVVIITLAEKGALVIFREKIFTAEAYSVDTVATVGAGDAFMSGFLHAILSNLENISNLENGSKDLTAREKLDLISEEDFAKAVPFACAVAALATTEMSAYRGLPSKEQALMMVKSGALK